MKGRAQVIDLDPKVAAGYQLEQLSAIAMTSSGPVTIAYKPASIPATALGAGPDGELQPFDDTNPSHLQTLQKVGKYWAKNAHARPWSGLFPSQP